MLGVLRRFAGFVQAHLPALDLVRVASDEPGFVQGFTQGLVITQQRSVNTVANCAGLLPLTNIAVPTARSTADQAMR